MAELMIELGADRAINLDGGGSTTMYVGLEGGVVNRPSRGWEREVINHIGVLAPPRGPARRAAPRHQPTPGRWCPGRARQIAAQPGRRRREAPGPGAARTAARRASGATR
jgi:hypothetical protein